MKPELIQVVKELRNLMQRQDQYIESIPREFQELVQDNEYSFCGSMQVDVLLQALFDTKYYHEVCWFLYEFTPGKSQGPHVRLPCGTHYTFLTDDDYYAYLETQ